MLGAGGHRDRIRAELGLALQAGRGTGGKPRQKDEKRDHQTAHATTSITIAPSTACHAGAVREYAENPRQKHP